MTRIQAEYRWVVWYSEPHNNDFTFIAATNEAEVRQKFSYERPGATITKMELLRQLINSAAPQRKAA